MRRWSTRFEEGEALGVSEKEDEIGMMLVFIYLRAGLRFVSDVGKCLSYLSLQFMRHKRVEMSFRRKRLSVHNQAADDICNKRDTRENRARKF